MCVRKLRLPKLPFSSCREDAQDQKSSNLSASAVLPLIDAANRWLRAPAGEATDPDAVSHLRRRLRGVELEACNQLSEAVRLLRQPDGPALVSSTMAALFCVVWSMSPTVCTKCHTETDLAHAARRVWPLSHPLIPTGLAPAPPPRGRRMAQFLHCKKRRLNPA